MNFVTTEKLKIAFETGGDGSHQPVFLLHGWPDAAVAWTALAESLQGAGYATIAPYLRGSFPTEFLASDTPRYAGAVAMAQDVMDLADQLGLGQFSVVGHDWGARVAYTLAALFPERVRAIAALALAYQPGGTFNLPDFQQSRHFWYQFFQCTPAGAEAVRRDPVGFARLQWETWSPRGWFTDADFREASKSFVHPDWAEITLNAYRSRYLPGEIVDHDYDPLHARLRATSEIQVPTLMIQGAADTCDLPKHSEGQAHLFRRGYTRVLLDGVGHFPHREAPALVAGHVLDLLAAALNGPR